MFVRLPHSCTFNVQSVDMWFKFAAIAALVFHRTDAVFERQRAVDYWLRGSGLRMMPAKQLPINKEWKTVSGQTGDALLRNVPAAAPSASARPPMPGSPDDWVPLQHKADGLPADHPANRKYK
jgi:hypothetical protein